MITIRKFEAKDVARMAEIWNQVVEDGVAFPQEENLTEETGDAFFKEQTYTGIAVNTDRGRSRRIFCRTDGKCCGRG